MITKELTEIRAAGSRRVIGWTRTVLLGVPVAACAFGCTVTPPGADDPQARCVDREVLTELRASIAPGADDALAVLDAGLAAGGCVTEDRLAGLLDGLTAGDGEPPLLEIP